MDDRLVTLKDNLQAHEAHLLQGVLEGVGIVAVIQNEHFSQLYGNALGGMRVMVSERDLDAARDVIEAVESDPDEGDG